MTLRNNSRISKKTIQNSKNNSSPKKRELTKEEVITLLEYYSSYPRDLNVPISTCRTYTKKRSNRRQNNKTNKVFNLFDTIYIESLRSVECEKLGVAMLGRGLKLSTLAKLVYQPKLSQNQPKTNKMTYKYNIANVMNPNNTTKGKLSGFITELASNIIKSLSIDFLVNTIPEDLLPENTDEVLNEHEEKLSTYIKEILIKVLTAYFGDNKTDNHTEAVELYNLLLLI